MNPAVKISLIVAACLIGAGLILSGLGLWLTGGRLWTADPTPAALDTVEITEPFADICIEEVEYDVRILPSPDGRCTVQLEQGRNERHDTAVKDGTLTISREKKWTWELFRIPGKRSLTLYLPEGEYRALKVATVSGDISLDAACSFDSAALATASGEIEAMAQVRGELRAESVSGDVAVRGIAPAALAVSAVSGDLSFCEVAAARVDAQTISGDIGLDRCRADALYLSSTSGDIEGTVAGELRFDASSTSGSVRVPPSAGGGTCRAATVSGRIDLSNAP